MLSNRLIRFSCAVVLMIKPKKLEKVDFRDNYNYICYIILTKSHLIRKSNIHLETQASNVHFFPFFFFKEIMLHSP